MFDDRQHAARQLAKHLLDLLIPEEDKLRENRFNIQLLTQRLVATTHLFEEPGTLEHATRRASDWFLSHLCTVQQEVEKDFMK